MAEGKPSLLAGLMAKKVQGNESPKETPAAPAAQGPVVPSVTPAAPASGGLLAGLAAGRVQSQAGGREVGVGRPESGSEASETRPALLAPKPSGILSAVAAGRERAEAAKAEHDYLFDEVPKDFQDVLDRFDKIMLRDQGDIDVDLPHMRNYVMRIMTDLRENPEFDGLIIDRDVHNIIAFMRRVKGEALVIADQKATKSAKSKAKPKASNRFAMDLDTFDLGASPAQPKLTVEDLSKLDFG